MNCIAGSACSRSRPRMAWRATERTRLDSAAGIQRTGRAWKTVRSQMEARNRVTGINAPARGSSLLGVVVPLFLTVEGIMKPLPLPMCAFACGVAALAVALSGCGDFTLDAPLVAPQSADRDDRLPGLWIADHWIGGSPSSDGRTASNYLHLGFGDLPNTPAALAAFDNLRDQDDPAAPQVTMAPGVYLHVGFIIHQDGGQIGMFRAAGCRSPSWAIRGMTGRSNTSSGDIGCGATR